MLCFTLLCFAWGMRCSFLQLVPLLLFHNFLGLVCAHEAEPFPPEKSQALGRGRPGLGMQPAKDQVQVICLDNEVSYYYYFIPGARALALPSQHRIITSDIIHFEVSETTILYSFNGFSLYGNLALYNFPKKKLSIALGRYVKALPCFFIKFFFDSLFCVVRVFWFFFSALEAHSVSARVRSDSAAAQWHTPL